MQRSRYAETTSVSVDKSKAEIEKTLARYGAERFAYGWSTGEATIGFVAHGRMIRFRLPLPPPTADEFTWSTSGKRTRRRTPAQSTAAWEQACRQRWRALALVIKAKLEAVAAGITTFEDEFLAHTVMVDGRTVGEWASPQLDASYASGRMPSLLPAPRD